MAKLHRVQVSCGLARRSRSICRIPKSSRSIGSNVQSALSNREKMLAPRRGSGFSRCECCAGGATRKRFLQTVERGATRRFEKVSRDDSRIDRDRVFPWIVSASAKGGWQLAATLITRNVFPLIYRGTLASVPVRFQMRRRDRFEMRLEMGRSRLWTSSVTRVRRW